MRLIDEFRAIFAEPQTEEAETMITDALTALTNAVNAELSAHASDKAALTQAQSDLANVTADRDAKAQQLADAESQINAITAQISPPEAQ